VPNPGLLLPPTEGRNCLGNLFGSNLFNSLTGGTVVGLTHRHGATGPQRTRRTGSDDAHHPAGWALMRRELRLTRLEACVLLAADALSLPFLASGSIVGVNTS